MQVKEQSGFRGGILMSGLEEIVQEMVNDVPDITAILFVDKDGIPMVSAGNLKFDSYDLGAIGAVCLETCQILGGDLGQLWIENVIIEFDDLKVVQCPTATGAMLILANKCADVDAIRKEAKNNMASISFAHDIEWSKGKFMAPPMAQKTETTHNDEGDLLRLMSLFKEKE
jgi:predicted regulator of Ras-like GTPase activity (Roadblock/LC7/MglB family)